MGEKVFHINPDGKNLDGIRIERDPALVHLYAGPSFHMEGFVVGNRAGLTALRDAINKALEGEEYHNAARTPRNEGGVFTRDGEGYEIIVIRQDTSWQGKAWSDLALPYTAEDGMLQNTEKDHWPHQLLTKEDDERFYGQKTT